MITDVLLISYQKIGYDDFIYKTPIHNYDINNNIYICRIYRMFRPSTNAIMRQLTPERRHNTHACVVHTDWTFEGEQRLDGVSHSLDWARRVHILESLCVLLHFGPYHTERLRLFSKRSGYATNTPRVGFESNTGIDAKYSCNISLKVSILLSVEHLR